MFIMLSDKAPVWAIVVAGVEAEICVDVVELEVVEDIVVDADNWGFRW